MSKQKAKNQNTGLTILLICGVIAVALIVGRVFFPDEIFGIFFKNYLFTSFSKRFNVLFAIERISASSSCAYSQTASSTSKEG